MNKIHYDNDVDDVLKNFISIQIKSIEYLFLFLFITSPSTAFYIYLISFIYLLLN